MEKHPAVKEGSTQEMTSLTWGGGVTQNMTFADIGGGEGGLGMRIKMEILIIGAWNCIELLRYGD